MIKTFQIKYVFTIIISLNLMIFAQELTPEEDANLDKLNADYAKDGKTASLYHAWLLYRSGKAEKDQKADTVLNQVISLLDLDFKLVTYGQWGWKWRGDEKTADFNNALFQSGMQRLVLYVSRCPFSLVRMIKVTKEGHVIYRAGEGQCLRFPEPGDERLREGISRNFEVFDALDFVPKLQRLCENARGVICF